MNVYVRELGQALAARGAAIDIFTRRQTADVPDVVEYAPGARVIHIDAGPHRHVDKYDILESLGQGGMNEAYKARDRQTGRLVVLNDGPRSRRDRPPEGLNPTGRMCRYRAGRTTA